MSDPLPWPFPAEPIPFEGSPPTRDKFRPEDEPDAPF